DGIRTARAEGPENLSAASGIPDGRREYRADRTIGRQAQPERRRASGAWSSNSEGRSATPSARSDSFDDIDGGPDCRVYIQTGGIEQVRVRRLFQRGRGPARIPLVACDNVRQHLGFVD